VSLHVKVVPCSLEDLLEGLVKSLAREVERSWTRRLATRKNVGTPSVALNVERVRTGVRPKLV
jgi:hypothetical protein